MNKQAILDELITKAKTELEKVEQAYETTKNLVQAGDLKSDGKYDTRGTEANYLADGQRKRISELEQDLQMLEEVILPKGKANKLVSIGSLVDIGLNGQIRKYFVSPTAGGTMVNIDGEVVLVISVFSPIGKEALNMEVGDSFELELKGDLREYSIEAIS